MVLSSLVPQEFKHIQEVVYLNHAGTSPIPFSSATDMQKAIQDQLEGRVSSPKEETELRREFREYIANLIHASSNSIAITLNTSYGLNILAQGLEWKAGDRVLLVEGEFPANLYPFLNLRSKGVEIDFVAQRHGEIWVTDIKQKLTPDTRLLSISFVEFMNGFRNNLKAIGAACQENGTLFCVDGTQGVGVMPLNVKECHIDFLACSGHKWLMWPRGVGFVYISPQIFQRIQPVFVGWAGVENQWDLLNTNQKWAKNTQRFETGTFNSIGIIGALRSLKLFLELGIPNIQRRILELTDFTLTKVQRKGYPLATSLSKEHRSGIVTFFYPKDTALHSFLLERGIIVTARNNTIRVSPHIYSDEEDVEFLMTAVDEFECKR